MRSSLRVFPWIACDNILLRSGQRSFSQEISDGWNLRDRHVVRHFYWVYL